MFRATLTNPRYLRDVIGCILPVLDETELTVEPACIKLRNMDDAHAALVDFLFPSSAFDTYTCSEPIRMKVRLKTLARILERSSEKENLDLKFDEGRRTLILSIAGLYDRFYSVATMPAAGETLPDVSARPVLRAIFDLAGFRKVIDDINGVSDSFSLSSDGQSLTMVGGDQLKMISATLHPQANILRTLESTRDIDVKYRINYILDVAKAASSICDILELQVLDNSALRITPRLPEGEYNLYISHLVEST